MRVVLLVYKIFSILLMVSCNATNNFPLQHTSINKCVYTDPQFSGIENSIIHNSLNEWSNKTNDLVTWSIKDWSDPKCNNSVLIIRNISTDQDVINIEMKIKRRLKGYTYKNNNFTYVLIVADNIENVHDYRIIMLHEIGHVLGLHHNDNNKSIMNDNDLNYMNGISDLDLYELYNNYGNY